MSSLVVRGLGRWCQEAVLRAPTERWGYMRVPKLGPEHPPAPTLCQATGVLGSVCEPAGTKYAPMDSNKYIFCTAAHVNNGISLRDLSPYSTLTLFS